MAIHTYEHAHALFKASSTYQLFKYLQVDHLTCPGDSQDLVVCLRQNWPCHIRINRQHGTSELNR